LGYRVCKTQVLSQINIQKVYRICNIQVLLKYWHLRHAFAKVVPALMTPARWRSGNAAVCKTDMHGFNSRPGLTNKDSGLCSWPEGIEAALRYFVSVAKQNIQRGYCFGTKQFPSIIWTKPANISVYACRDGVIGSHARLKILWPHGRAGSIPAPGTKN